MAEKRGLTIFLIASIIFTLTNYSRSEQLNTETFEVDFLNADVFDDYPILPRFPVTAQPGTRTDLPCRMARMAWNASMPRRAAVPMTDRAAA